MKRKDFKKGHVVTTESGKRYVVIDNRIGEVDFLRIDGKINSTGLTNDNLEICTGSKNGVKIMEKIVKVEEFPMAEPDRNKISCALRMGQGYGTKYELETVWKANMLSEQEIAHAKQQIREAEECIAGLSALLDGMA